MAREAGRWFCYMLRCADGSLYAGAAKDPAKRLRQHNWGFGAKHTSLRRPVTLLWQEQHSNERSAWGRAAEIKGRRREEKLSLASAGNEIYPSP